MSKKWLIIPLCFFNIVYTGAKFTQVFMEWDQREGYGMESVMSQLKSKSNIAGDARFYYKAIQGGHQFQLHDQYGDPEENAKKLLDWADYVLLAAPADGYSQKFRETMDHRLTFIGEYDYGKADVFYDLIPLAKNEASGMSFRLYKVEPPLWEY